MNTRQILALAFVTGTCAASYAGGHAEWAGYPVEGVVYKFEVYTGLKDRWDSTKQDAPPLAPGRALRAAKQFISKVPLREDMKEWGLRDITLQTLSPDEWVYVVHFDANPKSRTPDIGTKSRCVVFRSFDPENAIRVRGFCQCDALHTQRLVTHSRRTTSQYFEETMGMSGGLKSGVWNGPVPWIAVPVRMDGTIPKPVIERKKP